MRKNKQYEAIAEAIMKTRETVTLAYGDGTVPQAASLAALDKAAENIGKTLSARHRGDYPFRMSRWLEACGVK